MAKGESKGSKNSISNRVRAKDFKYNDQEVMRCYIEDFGGVFAIFKDKANRGSDGSFPLDKNGNLIPWSQIVALNEER